MVWILSLIYMCVKDLLPTFHQKHDDPSLFPMCRFHLNALKSHGCCSVVQMDGQVVFETHVHIEHVPYILEP